MNLFFGWDHCIWSFFWMRPPHVNLSFRWNHHIRTFVFGWDHHIWTSFFSWYINKHVQCAKREEEVLIHAKKKRPHKTPFFKVRASKKNSSKFFSLKKKFVVHTNKHVEQPQKFPRGAPLPFFSFYIFLFLLGASWRAGGRAGSFSRVHGTGAGHHPGAGTKARFFHGCNRAHATGGRD